MIKTIEIVCLSSGSLGEDYAKHELLIGKKRLNDYGINVRFSAHALMGVDYIKTHPEERANDLIEAILDDEVDLILSSIGGDDTYRLLPYLFEQDMLMKAIKKTGKKKIFLGFSDTTMNHLMFHRVGFPTFYGQAFLPDICELDNEMLPYSRKYFEELIQTGTISEIRPSDVWYEERNDFSEKALGIPRVKHENHGFELLQGTPIFSGEILGGCLESIYDIFDNSRYKDSISLCEKYHLFPTLEEWKGKIMLLETSEEQPSPELYKEMLVALKHTGVFGVVNGIICGKPMDEKFFDEYKKIMVEVINNKDLPIVTNLNIGHATPRCIIPFGKKAMVNVTNQVIQFDK